MKAIALSPAERCITLIDNHLEPSIVSSTEVKLQTLEFQKCIHYHGVIS